MRLGNGRALLAQREWDRGSRLRFLSSGFYLQIEAMVSKRFL